MCTCFHVAAYGIKITGYIRFRYFVIFAVEDYSSQLYIEGEVCTCAKPELG